MANEEHLEILRQGVEVWNRWREKYPGIHPDLNGANLSDLNLSGVNFSLAKLSFAKLIDTNLDEGNLSAVSLREADFSGAHLQKARLTEALLFRADFTIADLREANFSQAKLHEAIFNRAYLNAADFSDAIMFYTSFGDVDLGSVRGLQKVKHFGPSYVDFNTVYRSGGKISEEFLRGAGIADPFITYISSLSDAVKYYTCFICYSSKDEAFAKRLHADLQQQGVRCWFAPEDMKIGDKIRSAIDQSIRVHDKLLLILSENSINSEWVETEVETAFEEERKRKQTVLFPVRLDKAVMETEQAWAANIRTRHIEDFSRWKDHDAYQRAFARLMRDLKA